MLQLLVLMAVGLVLPALAFRWFLRRYGGMASPDEVFRMSAEIAKNEFRDQNTPKAEDPAYRDHISR